MIALDTSPHHCPACGANLALVGKVHRCSGMVANAPEPMANKLEDMANTIPDMANTMANTYQYRDRAKRRAYMRQYMRGRRSKHA